MSLARCGRLARLSLGARPVLGASPRALVSRPGPLVRGAATSSRDAQQKVIEYSMDEDGVGKC